MKLNMLLLALIVVTVVTATGCQVQSTAAAAVEAVDVPATTPSTVNEELVLITSATGQVKRIGQASITQGFSMAGQHEMLPYDVHYAFDRKDQGHSSAGFYEMWTLPDGKIAINLKSESCDFPQGSADSVSEKVAITTQTVSTAPALIVSAEQLQGTRQASFTQGFYMAGAHEMLPYEVHHPFDRQN